MDLFSIRIDSLTNSESTGLYRKTVDKLKIVSTEAFNQNPPLQLAKEHMETDLGLFEGSQKETQKSVETEDAELYDDDRDGLLRGLMRGPVVFLHSREAPERQAAKELLIVFDKYKDTPEENYTSETASIRILKNTLEEAKNKANLLLLGLDKTARYLWETNELFAQSVLLRELETIGQPTGRTLAARTQATESYRTFCDLALNLYTVQKRAKQDASLLEAVINVINSDREVVGTALAIKQGRKAASDARAAEMNNERELVTNEQEAGLE